MLAAAVAGGDGGRIVLKLVRMVSHAVKAKAAHSGLVFRVQILVSSSSFCRLGEI